VAQHQDSWPKRVERRKNHHADISRLPRPEVRKNNPKISEEQPLFRNDFPEKSAPPLPPTDNLNQLSNNYVPPMPAVNYPRTNILPEYNLDSDVQGFGSQLLDRPNKSEKLNKPKGSRVPWFAGLCAIVFICSFSLYFWGKSQIDPSGEPGLAVIVDIPSGSSSKEISSILETNGVIPSSTGFDYYIKLSGQGQVVQAGTYELQENMSVSQVLAAMEQGPNANKGTLIAEGLWVSETIAQLDEKLPNVSSAELYAVLDAGLIRPNYFPGEVSCPEAVPYCAWEGFLFPSKYDFAENVTAQDVIQQMVNEFNRVADEAGLNDQTKLNGRTPYDVLIVASLIESEAAVDEDRRKISEVIYHRLGGEDLSNSWLGIDATVIYSLASRNPGDGVVVARHKDSNDPYNTSALGGSATRQKLPLTPISAPGVSSIKAALNPTAEGYKWYTLPDPNTNIHQFSRSKVEHDEADAAHDAKVAAAKN